MRKFTTQILSLLTALLFTGAISAQSVGDLAADTGGSSSDKLGLRFGLGFGLDSDVLNQSSGLGPIAVAFGGGGIAGNSGTKALLTSGALTSATGSGDATSVTGVELAVNVQYDILPWLHARTGLFYHIGGKAEYSYKISGNQGALTTGTPNSVTLDSSYTFTTEASQMDIPVLIGFDLIKTDKSSIYFDIGVSFTSGKLVTTSSATQTGGTFATTTNTTDLSTMGLMYIIGGRTEIMDNISIFAEMKKLSGSAVGSKTVAKSDDASATATGTTHVAGTSVAGASVIKSSTIDTQATSGTAEYGNALNFSYTSWNLGVSYDM